MEYEKAYVYQPDGERSAKRQRVAPQGLQSSWKRRRQAFDHAWNIQQRAIDERLESVNTSITNEVSEFLDHATRQEQVNRIPTGIILTGPSGTSNASIKQQLSKQSSASNGCRTFVSLSSGSGTNLKALLKTLIQKATLRHSGVDEDDEELQSTRKRGTKLLNYDLQLLYDYVRAHRTEQVVITFEDTEAFNSDLLSELLELLGCWRDRIPLVCVLNVATSVDFLQLRLSKAAVKSLDGRLFDVAPSRDEVEQVFEAVINSGASLWLGSGLASTALERQHDYIQSIDTFVEAVKYAYMSAYYANALTIFLDISSTSSDITADHLEALRNSESYRTYARCLLDDGETARVRDYLESDASLQVLVLDKIAESQRKLSNMMYALKVLRLIQQNLPNTPVSTLSSLYIQAMSGKIIGSALIRSLLSTMRKVASNFAISLLEALLELDADNHKLKDCAPLLKQLEDLIASQKATAQPLRSEDDIANSTLRTTVVAQKVELSKQRSALSEQDKAYTGLLGRLSKCLEDFFANALVDPKDMVFNEIFVYDLKSPYREVFTPRPRHAVERALATPHDYLDCDCCAPGQGQDGEAGEATLASAQPATAVLYQLYLESGSLINASDLWQAFQAVMGDGKEEAETMALFQRALAELRCLGMMKGTRKRVDHVAKVMWRGL